MIVSIICLIFKIMSVGYFREGGYEGVNSTFLSALILYSVIILINARLGLRKTLIRQANEKRIEKVNPDWYIGKTRKEWWEYLVAYVVMQVIAWFLMIKIPILTWVFQAIYIFLIGTTVYYRVNPFNVNVIHEYIKMEEELGDKKMEEE